MYKTIASFNGDVKIYDGKLGYANLLKLTGEMPKNIEHIEVLHKDSDFGDFYSWSNKIVENNFGSNFKEGFPIVNFLKDGSDVEVVTAFGELENGVSVLFDKDNLEWVTPSENQIHAIENKLKIPKKGKDAYWYGKNHSLESKIKIGIGAKGRKHTEDVKIKMSIDRMYKAPNSLKVINTDTGEVYNSITEAADKNNISRRVINYGIKTKKFNLEILK